MNQDLIRHDLMHDIATLREMLNPSRVHDDRYLRLLKEWIATVGINIDKLLFERMKEDCEKPLCIISQEPVGKVF